PATPNGNQHSLHTASHSGPNARNNPEFDPRAVFKRLFAGGIAAPMESGAELQAERTARARTSVLDVVKTDAMALQQRLGATDKQRVEKHLEGIRSIERRLEVSQDTGEKPSQCQTPTQPSIGPDTTNEAP